MTPDRPRVRGIAVALLLGAVAASAAGGAQISDAAAIERRLEALVPGELERRHLPGAVIVVATRDRVLLRKGYGYAHLRPPERVDPDATTFRVASVSKLFTATAVIQLVERGIVELDTDVNAYLRLFRVPEAFEEPVTLRHLLTHTAGFGARFLGHRARERRDQLALGDYLAARLPSRFIAPGRIFSYANHGMALAGFVVESATGRPFHEYVAREILAPLGMERSGFGMDAELVASLATGYVHDGHIYRPVPIDFRHEVPSGSLITTGSDMARFLRVQLAGGALDGRRVLAEPTLQAMQRRQFSHHPLLEGVGFGFLERRIDGRRYVGHDGDIVGYNARLLLAPELGLGLFMAYTGLDTTKAFANEVTKSVFGPIQRPAPSQRPARVAIPAAELRRFEGTYRWTRTARDTLERLVVPYWMVQFRVEASGDGELVLAAPFGLVSSSSWQAVGPLAFQQVDGDAFVAFREAADGTVTHLFLDPGVPMALQRVGPLETIAVQTALAAGFPICFAAIAVGAGARAVRARRRDPRISIAAALLVAAIAAGNAGAWILLPWALGPNLFSSDLLRLPGVTPGNPAFYYGAPPLALALLTLPLLGLGGLAALLGLRLRVPLGASRAAGAAAFALLVLAFAAYLHYWNLLGYRL